MSFSGSDPVTLVTGGLLAASAAVTPFIPFALARRKARQDAVKTAREDAGTSASLTLASWTALNGALQTEITRLQGVVDKLQGRVDTAEAEIDSLRARFRTLPEAGKGA